jgi:hypothetical protein
MIILLKLCVISRLVTCVGRFVPWDVLGRGAFSAVGRLEMGRFESGTFCAVGRLVMGPLVMGRF